MQKEEIKQLKKGDKILIEAIFDRIDEDGDAAIEYTNSVSDCECGFIDPKHIVGVASKTQLNKQKYDPCRLFKEGDKVRRRKVLEGRYLSCMMHDLPFDTEFTVISGEKNAMVGINKDNDIHWVSFAMLELVTHVEELEPYSVRESDAFDIVREGKIVMTIPFTEDDYYTFEQAKAAAAEECDRLNTEWRKEQSNG